VARAHATREILAPREDVWTLIAEPYHLPDWWPAYTGVQPDRRGLAENARWKVVRARKPGLLRRGGRDGLIVITRVVPGEELRWRDVEDDLEGSVRLERSPGDRTRATLAVAGRWWRMRMDGAGQAPRAAADRLYELCQTAATL
jgi:uncharacterized protein YndB with AHSA1/START domain